MNSKLVAISILFVLVGFVFVAPVSAQTPTTSQRTTGHNLADAAMSTNVTMNAFILCMDAGGKEKACKGLAFREAERSERVAKQAAKAARQSGVPFPSSGYNLADVAMVTDVNVRAFIACIATKASEGTCKDLANREAERSEEVAKQVAKSTDQYDPCSGWNPPRGCIYQYGYGGGYGYGYGSPGAYQPLRRQPAPPPRNNNDRGQAVPRGSAYGGTGNGSSGNTSFLPGANGSGVNGNGSSGNTVFLPGANGSGANNAGRSGSSGSGGNTNGTGVTRKQ